MLDDIVAFGVSGTRKMLFVNEIVFPECVLGEGRIGGKDEFVAFSGDFHVGSSMFLEKNFLKFVGWLNGEVGDERQKMIARKVKYLVLTGDLIDGVGVYPGQEGWLRIRDIRGQYRKVAELLGKIRGDVEIVACAGQHDAVWVGESQRCVSEKWAKGLYEMGNLRLAPNPSLVDIGGFKVLMYHGSNRILNSITSRPLRSQTASLPDRFAPRTLRSQIDVVREMLRRGHLAPTHGLMDYVPTTSSLEQVGGGWGRLGEDVAPVVAFWEDRDGLVIAPRQVPSGEGNVVPDIIATGGQHRAEVDSYNNILMVASSCWQSVTPFEEKVGNVPEPCRVPLFNLKTREIKVVDFGGDEVKLGGSE